MTDIIQPIAPNYSFTPQNLQQSHTTSSEQGYKANEEQLGIVGQYGSLQEEKASTQQVKSETKILGQSQALDVGVSNKHLSLI